MTPGCSGACEQGRRPCPTPQACEVEDALAPARGAICAITYVIWAAVALGLLGWAVWLLVRLIGALA